MKAKKRGEGGVSSNFVTRRMLALRASTQQLNLQGTIRKRGKVLRDPNTGPGLLMIEGRQYQFWLDQKWSLDVPPRPGLPVDVTFNSKGQIQLIAAVPAAQLEKEARAQQSGKTKLRRVLWNAVERCFH